MKLSIKVGQGPHSQLTETLNAWLWMHAMMYRKTQRGAQARKLDHRYASTEELVLFAGKRTDANFYEMNRFEDMALGQCFSNAFQCAHGDWEYTEGWGIFDHGLPTHHAWLTNSVTGEVDDPTWRKNYKDNAARHPNETWTGNVVYHGISIHRFDHAAWCERYQYPNLLSIGDWDIPEVRKYGTDAFTMDLSGICSLCHRESDDEGDEVHDADCPRQRLLAIIGDKDEIAPRMMYGG